MRAAVIGCGLIAGLHEDPAGPGVYSHGKAYALNPAVTGIGFVDADPGRAESLAAKFSGRAFPDAAALLSRFKPELVSVCVPDALHFPVLREILEHPRAPKAVFAEKPLCSDRKEFEALVRLERESGSRIVVNHSRRFDRAHRRLRDLIRGGSLGGLVRGGVDYYGGFRHLGVHIVDALQFFFGEPLVPEGLTLCCESKVPGDPTLDGRLMLGRAAVTLAGFPESLYQIVDMNLLFERGQIRITDFGRRVEVLRKSVSAEGESLLGPDPAFSGPGMEDPIVAAVDLLARFAAAGDASLIAEFGLDEARKTMETLWSAVY